MMDKLLRERLDTSGLRIVDSHAHLGFNGPFDIQGDCADDLIVQMDHAGVQQAAISPLAGLCVDVRLGNDMTEKMLLKYPGRLIGMALANPNKPEEILPELERCFDRLHMSMIKIHPAMHSCPMSAKSYDLIYGFANERGLLILNHDWQSPKRMEALARAYPNMRLVQAHSAGNWDGHREEDYFRVARDCPNAYVDIVHQHGSGHAHQLVALLKRIQMALHRLVAIAQLIEHVAQHSRVQLALNAIQKCLVQFHGHSPPS